ncbi:hypothetical protein RJT12_11035 [Segatella copri]|uniref:hypothetical protein n=1 Tax=Segatella copri TaxID=165179 RepID=UPI00258D1858|nr:hypothetical protein [Segatella copri]WOF95969.1 hypothetical protein RJT12_11035 [Segatella copri]
MADNQKVYQAIKTIADELCKENKTYLRADLAFELKKYGIASDSSEVSKLVFDAYRYFHDNGNIAIAFVSNNSRTTLVAEYKLNDSLEQGNKEEALKIAETELALSSSALEQLKEQVELNLNLVLAKGTSKMADIVMGTNGVKDVRSKASTMFDKYTKMVEAYHYAEDSVRGNIEDFTSLRSDIGTVYRDYALKLIDIYGDSIKMVSPDLFDFKRIEWLDVDEMLKYVELEYSKLTEKCAALIGEISDSFRTSLQGSLQAYKSLSNGNKSLGLAMAGLTMLEHYMGASERANRLKSDLSVFQMSVKHDATRIKADMGRLLVICKTLNDVVIPKANVFLRYGEKLLASDLKATLDVLYADETIRPLEEQRKCLLQQMKALDMEMNDHLQNIDVYTSLINDITATLESKQGSYMEAKAKKPSKPFFLLNWLTFGMVNKNYYRDFAEWNAVCFPLVREYESYQVDLKLDKEELESHREEQTRIKNEYAKLSSELDKVSKEIRSKIVCSDDLKLKMLKHLRDMVAMLKLGREIMESKIDEKLVHTVDIPDYRETAKLPADVEQNLSLFTGMLADNLHADKDMAKNLLDGVEAYTKDPKKIEGKTAQQNKPAEYSEEDLAQVTGAMEQSLQKGIALFDSFAKLKAQQLSGSLASAAYDKELKKHADEFKREMAKIDNKSAYLREVFKRINLAGSEVERKQAMELMSDLSGFSLSEQEFTEFINGKKQIEL